MHELYRKRKRTGNFIRRATLAAWVLCGALSTHAAAPPDPIPARQPAPKGQVLIASDGSTFKDQLVAALVSRLGQRKLEAKVIDLTGLADINGADWGAIVIVHNWEFGQPPETVRDFLARVQDPHRIIDVISSTSGTEKMAGVDVVSTASVVDDIPARATEIDAKVAALLKSK